TGSSAKTGEVTRYLSTYGPAQIDRAVLIGPIPPYLPQAPENPDGVPGSRSTGFRQAAVADTPPCSRASSAISAISTSSAVTGSGTRRTAPASTWQSRCPPSPPTT